MKRFLPFCSILCCAVFISACEQDEAPEVPFLTIDMTRADENKWIFATNEQGELLDLVRADLTNRSVQQLKTNKRYSSVDLTYLTIFRDEQTAMVYVYGSTYRNIPLSITVDAGYPTNDFGTGTYLGALTITLNNYTGSIADLIITTNRGDIPYDGLTVSGQKVTATMTVYDNSEYLILSAWREGVPVYYRQEVQSGNLNVEVDFNSFAPMENIQTLNQVQFASIAGIVKNERRHAGFLSRINYEGNAGITIGTIPGFQAYASTIARNGQTYSKLGSPLTAAENIEQKFANYSLEVTNRNIKTFSFNFSDDYDYKMAYPYSKPGPVGLSWAVYAAAADEARMLFDIPAEIISEYPELADYAFTDEGWVTIFKSLNQSFTYSDFLKEQLLFQFKTEYERLVISY